MRLKYVAKAHEPAIFFAKQKGRKTGVSLPFINLT